MNNLGLSGCPKLLRIPIQPNFVQHHCILSNLSSQTQSLEVVERIPVSEIKQVEISPDLQSTQPPTRPDENGFLRWTLELGPRSKTLIETAYWTRRRKEVVNA